MTVRESRCRTTHVHLGRTVNKQTWSNPRYNTELFYFSVWVFETPNERASIIMNERENDSISRRTGNGFNKIMSTGNGFNKVIMHILPSRQEREILFEATRTCLWLKLCLQRQVCEICNTTARHKCRGFIYHQIKYFAKVTSAFTIFLHRRHGRFIVYQFKIVSLFSNRDS